MLSDGVKNCYGMQLMVILDRASIPQANGILPEHIPVGYEPVEGMVKLGFQ